MKMVDRRYRLGGAPIAVPVTETERIPSWEEVATVQTISRRLEEYVPLVDPVVDWAPDRGDARPARRRRHAPSSTRRSADLAGAGIDIRDPAQLLLVLKRLGSDPVRGAVRRRRARRRSSRAAAGRSCRPTWCERHMAERERLLAELRERGERRRSGG